MTLNITTQGRYLLALLRNGPKTPSDLYAAGIKSPSSLVTKLRDAGVSITAQRVTGTNCYGDRCVRLVAYQLDGAEPERAQPAKAMPPEPSATQTEKSESGRTINVFSQTWTGERPATARDGLILIDRHDPETMASLPSWADADVCRVALAFEERFIAVNTVPKGRTTTGVGGLAAAAMFWSRLSRSQPELLTSATLLTNIKTRFMFSSTVSVIMRGSSQGAA